MTLTSSMKEGHKTFLEPETETPCLLLPGSCKVGELLVHLKYSYKPQYSYYISNTLNQLSFVSNLNDFFLIILNCVPLV